MVRGVPEAMGRQERQLANSKTSAVGGRSTNTERLAAPAPCRGLPKDSEPFAYHED